MRIISRTFAVAGLLLSPALAFSQGFILAPGQSVDVTFNQFALDDTGQSPASTSVILVGGSGFGVNNLRIDFYENSTADAPLSTALGTFLPIKLPAGAWNDLQGVARFTAVNDPVNLDHANAVVILPNGDRYFESLAVVPEPRATLLLGGVMLGALAFRRRN